MAQRTNLRSRLHNPGQPTVIHGSPRFFLGFMNDQFKGVQFMAVSSLFTPANQMVQIEPPLR